MKYTLNFLIQLFYLFPLFSQERYDIKFILDGRLRESIVVKPSAPPPAGGYPVVYMLHGTSGDGEKFYNISGWKELGERENFITVFPSSLSWCFVQDGIEEHNTRWVNGNVTDNPCSGPPQNYVDDVKFLKLLAKLISDSLPVNKRMIFASGFSNGSSMIHKLSIDAGDVFTAVAGTSSPLTVGDSAKPVNRIPVWHMLGTLDDRFIVPPFTELPFGGDSILGYLQNSLIRSLVCQGLKQTYIKIEGDSVHTYQFLESQSGEISKPYLFSLLKGMPHIYPTGNNYPLNAPKIFWEFFKKSVLVGTNNNVAQQTSIQAFPNPSNNEIQIILSPTIESYNWRLYDAFGRIIKSGQQTLGNSINFYKSELGSGWFLFQVNHGEKIGCQKIFFN